MAGGATAAAAAAAVAPAEAAAAVAAAVAVVAAATTVVAVAAAARDERVRRCVFPRSILLLPQNAAKPRIPGLVCICNFIDREVGEIRVLRDEEAAQAAFKLGGEQEGAVGGSVQEKLEVTR